jgi:hypothetical protein
MRNPRRNFNAGARLARVATGIALAILAGGCLGYRLGTTLPPDIKSIYVPVFVNKASYPQLETETTSAAIQALQLDGTLKVTTRDKADTLLDVTLTGYSLTAISYDPTRPTSANEYRMTLKATLTLTRRTTKKVIAGPVEVSGETTFILSGDMAAAQRTALPSAAKDLATRIVEQVTEYW